MSLQLPDCFEQLSAKSIDTAECNDADAWMIITVPDQHMRRELDDAGFDLSRPFYTEYDVDTGRMTFWQDSDDQSTFIVNEN